MSFGEAAAMIAIPRRAALAGLASIPLAALSVASVYLAATFLNLVRTFPFSLDWSEISRYYQASFYFAKQIYGVSLPLPVTHPSRYLLQSFPFLISASPIWLHRLWQAILWIGMPLLTGWLLARRFRITGSLLFAFVLWSFLFLMQGAVFYHLLPCVFIILIGFDKKRFWRSFFFVAVASIWAGVSRVNWFPVPGVVAALFYILGTKPTIPKNVLSFQYLWQPMVYALGGTISALGTYVLYIRLSGVREISQFGSAFTSSLLWERLLPNDAFPLGIFLGIALVSAPLFVLLWLRVRRKNPLGLWRAIGVAALLAVFFAGGLVVSVKIGGGTNLHNMDGFMALLWITASLLAFGEIVSVSKLARLKVPASLTVSLVAVPILFAVFSGAPLNLPTQKSSDQDLIQIQQLADEALGKGGDVLFISQRHLLTFHLIKNVPLVPEYEKLFLMEMAISNNQTYLANFQHDIDQQRFTLIITDPLFGKIEDFDEDVLAPENNAWVRNVSRPILCAYEPVVTYADLNIQILTPRYGDKCNQ